MNAPTTSTKTHPCFDKEGLDTIEKLHLPTASKVNARLRFGAPAMPKHVLTPEQALGRLTHVLESGKEVGMVGLTGPGDPMATPDLSVLTMRLIREAYPEMPLCLTTNGLGVAERAGILKEIGLSHVTILVNAIDPETVAGLYAWIRPGKRTVPVPKAAADLVNAQFSAIAALKEAGIAVKVNTTVYPGINDTEITRVAEEVAGLGADVMGIMPYRPTASDTNSLEIPGSELMESIREAAAKHIKLMPAMDVCGDILAEPMEQDEIMPLSAMPMAMGPRTKVAVATEGGMEVDVHLGQAQKFLVYGPREDDGLACLLETRVAPPAGGGAERWNKLGELLEDCFAVLVSGAGETPRKALAATGITVMITEGDIEGLVDVLYGGGKKGGKK